IDKPADNLTMIKNEGHFMAADFQHGAAARAARSRMADTGVEETRIMDAKFTDQRIVRHHLRCMRRRHMHRLPGHENIKFVRIEYQLALAAAEKRIPVIEHGIGIAPVDIDE